MDIKKDKNGLDIKELINDADEYLAMAYLAMGESDVKAGYFVDLFWKMVERTMSKTMKYIRKKTKGHTIDTPNLIDLLYDDKDEERIERYFEEFKNNKNRNSKIKFLQKLNLIFYTQLTLIINNTFLYAAEKLDAEINKEKEEVWVHLYSPDGSECGEIFDGDYYWGNVEPYCGHPNCDCYLNDVWVELKDLNKIDIVED